MDQISEKNIEQIAKGLAHATLSLVGSGIIPGNVVLNIANRDYIQNAFKTALMELIEPLKD